MRTSMGDEVSVILDLSDEVQTLLEQQDVDLYQELQQAVPSLRIVRGHDPASPEGSRDVVQILQALPAVIGALTPIILALLKHITPPNQAKTWVIIEKTETRQPGGTVIIQRKQVRESNEQRPWITPDSS